MYLPLCFAISSSLKRIPLQKKLYVFHENIPPKTRKSVTLANCSGSFCLIVLVESSGYTRNILCYVSSGGNSEIKPAFTKYGAKHTQGSSTGILSPSMSELPGYKQHRRVFFRKMKQLPAKSTTKKDKVYIGDICLLKSASSTDARSFQMWLE